MAVTGHVSPLLQPLMDDLTGEVLTGALGTMARVEQTG
jgi:hypothetical protein